MLPVTASRERNREAEDQSRERQLPSSIIGVLFTSFNLVCLLLFPLKIVNKKYTENKSIHVVKEYCLARTNNYDIFQVEKAGYQNVQNDMIVKICIIHVKMFIKKRLEGRKHIALCQLVVRSQCQLLLLFYYYWHPNIKNGYP